MVVDPEGRVHQEMGDGEAIMIEILDLDIVTKAREYGTIGLGPFLKHLREYHHDFSCIQGTGKRGSIQDVGKGKSSR